MKTTELYFWLLSVLSLIRNSAAPSSGQKPTLQLASCDKNTPYILFHTPVLTFTITHLHLLTLINNKNLRFTVKRLNLMDLGTKEKPRNTDQLIDWWERINSLLSILFNTVIRRSNIYFIFSRSHSNFLLIILLINYHQITKILSEVF